jgi:hypothetical protein
MTNQEKRNKIAYEIRALRKIAPPKAHIDSKWKLWTGGFLFGMLVALDPDERTYHQVQRMINIEEPLPKCS